MAKGKESQKLIANNKKAYHDFFIDETYECGIALHGTEVKSMRMGKCSIKEAFVRIEDGEVFVYGMHVSPYEKGNIFNKDPLRVKKLLLHKYEINKLLGKIKEKVDASVLHGDDGHESSHERECECKRVGNDAQIRHSGIVAQTSAGNVEELVARHVFRTDTHATPNGSTPIRRIDIGAGLISHGGWNRNSADAGNC